MYHALIMAGGSGTRLWPLSRKRTPKQALPLLEERSMFRVTAERLSPLIPLERVWVVTNEAMAGLFKEQVPGIPAENYVIEPSAKDSGPAAGLGLTHVHQADPEATVAILSADHHIGKVPEFLGALQAAYEVAQRDIIVTLGITPTFASTGFGYIERGQKLGEQYGFEVYEAVRFTEKPKQEVAEQYLAGGLHSWNSGMFIMTARTGLGEFARQQAPFADALSALEPAIGTPGYAAALDNAWQIAPKKSIDYAIMEGAERIAVIPVDIEWSDIGSWASLLDILPKDTHGNVFVGEHVAIDTLNTLVRGDANGNGRVIATLGLKDVVIVDTPDALLVCSLDRVGDLKQVVEKLRDQKRDELL
jgi:mannose-1-phosphate guanylyltransferase